MRWLRQRGWDGAALAQADAARWTSVSSSERAAQRRLQRNTGRPDGMRAYQVSEGGSNWARRVPVH
eukprot:851721-Alexandrium_andersonii.AAC.1